jgi:hypothetical protein
MFRTWHRQDLSVFLAFLVPDTSIFAMEPKPPLFTKQKNLFKILNQCVQCVRGLGPDPGSSVHWLQIDVFAVLKPPI